jgi:hypothetical protein
MNMPNYGPLVVTTVNLASLSSHLVKVLGEVVDQVAHAGPLVPYVTRKSQSKEDWLALSRPLEISAELVSYDSQPICRVEMQ